MGSIMSYLKLKHFLFLLVLLVSCALCSSHSGTDDGAMAAPPPPPPGFDYFVLSLQWPNALCTEAYVTCRPSPPAQQYFTVHGLWPQNEKGSAPIDCQATPVPDDILVALKDDLMDYWPRLYSAKNFEYSKKFWREQWSKHGSCSSNEFEHKQYFEHGIALGKDYGQKILNYLELGAVKPDGTTEYSSTKVLTAIKKGTIKKVTISCTTDKNGKLQLSEVRLCFDKDAKTLKDCTKGGSTCNAKFIFASEPLPPTPPPPPPPRRYPSIHIPSIGLASSMLDVEEAVEF